MDFLTTPTNTGTHAYGTHRQLHVLSWLREFRYSSAAILGGLIGIEGPYTGNLRRFLKTMEEQGLIRTYKHEVLRTLPTLFMLGEEAPAKLFGHGLPHEHLVLNPVHVRRSKTAYHDLNLQHAVIKRMENLRTIHSENQLQLSEGGQLKPDLIAIGTNGKKVAYEYELTRKSNVRIYHTFTSHLHAIRQGQYGGVVYLFATDSLCNTYEELFNATAWPTTRREQDGRVLQHGAAFNPDAIHDRKKTFMFRAECHLSPT